MQSTFTTEIQDDASFEIIGHSMALQTEGHPHTVQDKFLFDIIFPLIQHICAPAMRKYDAAYKITLKFHII